VRIALSTDLPAVWCKLEYLNPSGSTKDRIAAHILLCAHQRGILAPGQLVIEASSGSTSIAFALACARQGLRFIAVMPEGVSNERVLMIRAFGAEVRFTPSAEGVAGSIAEAERLGAELGAFLPRQFENPDNAAAHQLHNAAEISAALPDVTFDAVVSGVGTGGTLAGLYAGLRVHSPELRPVLARPVAISEELDMECCSFSSQIPGVIDGLSKLFRAADYPELLTLEVPQEKAIETTRLLINSGFPVGPSSGLNYAAAVMTAQQMGGERNIVTVFPDRMERYFSTMLFAPWR
jgi:cysteine synthase A